MTKPMLSFFSWVGKASMVSLFVISAFAQADDRAEVERLSILGRKEALPTRPGSAHIINEKELNDFQVGDIHRVLRSVPGVNIQEEDGFGLRPNIGLRGANPHRSKKITIMEDGVLIGPAPYSAPAAYYFPMLEKMSAVEVFKGTPSVMYGPNSVGGAINLVTSPNDPGLDVAASFGSYDFRKYKVGAGFSAYGDVSLNLSRIETSGFKQLPSGSDTGFVRQNANLRWDKVFSSLEQNLTLKINYASEDSDETYLGLTDADFALNPYQRYSASENDHMAWEHKQAFLSYAVSPTNELRARITLYRHQFDRAWFKVNGFYDDPNASSEPPTLDKILKEPFLATNNYYYRVLAGQADSQALSDNLDVIEKGNNDRSYTSQGVQTQWDYEWLGEWVDQFFTLFYRFHQDSAERDHVSTFYNMTAGQLVRNQALSAETTLRNLSQASAHTLALKHSVEIGRLSWQSAIRFEDIQYEEENFKTGAISKGADHILAPGVGLFYQAWDSLGFLFGVHKGFTPTGPGQAPGVQPEEALNYELGLRYTGWLAAEIIGFYSDYTNILGTCTFSGGCTDANIDQRFNGGEAEVKGVEFLLHKEVQHNSWTFPFRFNATYSQALFKNSFVSNNPEWGLGTVVSGDPIPYIPEWQAQLSFGVSRSRYYAMARLNYLSSLPDQAVALDRFEVPARTVVDLTLGYRLTKKSLLQLRADNLFAKDYGVSYRPQGLRPGRPQTFILGYEIEFF